MPRLIGIVDLPIGGGKGGLGGECVKAMHEKGCIYVSLLGAAPDATQHQKGAEGPPGKP